ncbi:hypothetical protein Tco_0506690 [Tanacetum coccineum]
MSTPVTAEEKTKKKNDVKARGETLFQGVQSTKKQGRSVQKSETNRKARTMKTLQRPNKLDLSYSGLDEVKEPKFKGYGPKNNKKESNVVCDKELENFKANYE